MPTDDKKFIAEVRAWLERNKREWERIEKIIRDRENDVRIAEEKRKDEGK